MANNVSYMKWNRHSRYIVGTVAGYHPFTTFLEPFPEGQRIARSIEEQVRSKGGKIIDVIQAITEWVYENINYVPDIVEYHTAEYFASPRLTLDRHAGDCEDFAFLIASMLNSLKVKPTGVYVTVGIYKDIMQPSSYHAWTYIKDGVIAEGTAGWLALKGDDKYKRYHPIFGIQQDAIYIFRPIKAMEKALNIKSSPLTFNVLGADIDFLPIAEGVGASLAMMAASEGAKYAVNYAKKKGWLK